MCSSDLAEPPRPFQDQSNPVFEGKLTTCYELSRDVCLLAYLPCHTCAFVCLSHVNCASRDFAAILNSWTIYYHLDMMLLLWTNPLMWELLLIENWINWTTPPNIDRVSPIVPLIWTSNALTTVARMGGLSLCNLSSLLWCYPFGRSSRYCIVVVGARLAKRS